MPDTARYLLNRKIGILCTFPTGLAWERRVLVQDRPSQGNAALPTDRSTDPSEAAQHHSHWLGYIRVVPSDSFAGGVFVLDAWKSGRDMSM